MRAWLSWTMSRRVRLVVRSREGLEGWVPIHSWLQVSGLVDDVVG